jgi:hypothetical protein
MTTTSSAPLNIVSVPVESLQQQQHQTHTDADEQFVSRHEKLKEFFDRFAIFIKEVAFTKVSQHTELNKLCALSSEELATQLSIDLVPYKEDLLPPSKPLNPALFELMMNNVGDEYQAHLRNLTQAHINKIRLYMCCFISILVE